MDYEKKYKEALERAEKEWSNNLDNAYKNYRERLEFIFPELKESEDEKIRKDLVNIVEWLKYNPKTLGQYYGDKYDKILAWLEKQGKQKHLDYPYIPGWRENRPDNKPQIKHSVLMLTTHGVAEGEWLGEEWRQYRWSCKLKDADVLYWLHLSDLESLEKEGEQKPAWSEEDEHRVKDIIYFLDTAKKHYASTVELDACIEWLKSLKPQKRWKPSDEQVGLLQAIVNDPNNSASESCQVALKEIIKQLKKLTE